MNDPASGLSVLHVVVRAGPTNCQYNEHVLPVVGDRHLTVCSLFPADVTPPPGLTLHEGDGSVRGGARALRRALTSDSYDVVHVHAPASAMLTLAVYRRLRRPRADLVFTIHNSWRNFRFRNRIFLRVVLAVFPLVVVCGQAALESVPRRLVRRARGRLTVVPNGVDVDRVQRVLAGRPAPSSRHSARGFTIVSLNRLIPLKDPSTLLRAFDRVRRPGDRLVMIGDGPLRRRVETEISARRLGDCVTLTGVVPRDEVYRRLAEADLFVSTSGGEGLPVALLEAMACEVPVVVSDIPPHREVSQAAGGLPLVETRDHVGFARAIDRVRALDPLDRYAIGRHLGEVVGERFSVRAMNAAYGALYRQLVDARVASPTRSGRRRGRVAADVPLGDKLKRHVLLLSVLTVLGAAAGFGIALVQAPVYKGETSVRVGPVTADEDTLNASAALASVYADLARREPVLGPLVEASRVEDWKQLQADVYSRVGDKNPQLVEISVYANDRRRAEEMADAVAGSLEAFARRALRSSDGAFLEAQLQSLRTDIEATTRELTSARGEASSATGAAAIDARARVDELQATLTEQRSGYADLRTLDAAEAGTLSRVDEAWTVRSPLRPTPMVLAVAGAAAVLIVAVGWLHLFGRGPAPAPVGTGATGRQPHQPTALRDLRAHRATPRAPATPWAGPEPPRQRPEERTRASEL